jgi:nucleoside phosphorylase
MASIDRVAQTAAEKGALRARGAGAVEMEAAGVAEAAGRLNLPVYCIRSVTDLAGESFALDFNAALREDGRFDAARILLQAVRKPSAFPGLIRLRRRCQTASRNLGDFLAGCRF